MVGLLFWMQSAQGLELERCYPHSMFSEAFCGSYSVLEDRSKTDGRKIDLNVMLVPSVRANSTFEPIFIFAGGPGQGAVDVAATVMPSLLKMNQQRTIVFLDQRGTGSSNPLQCEISTTDSSEVPTEELRACIESLSADTTMYHTDTLVKDTAEVQKALGFEKINIYGVSYGTRLGLAYLRTYPELVRSAVLDGVAPLDIPIGSDYGEGVRNAFTRMLLDCVGDQACRDAFPNLKTDFESLEQKLIEPTAISYLNPKTAELENETIEREDLWGVVQQMLYSPISSSMLPFVINEATQDNWAPLMAWGKMGEGTFESIPIGLYLSIVCAEDIPRIEPNSTFENQMGGNSVSSLNEMCSVWKSATIDTAFFEPVSSAIPILLLSGENDPVTPPKNGEQALQTLSNAKHIIVPGVAHNTLQTECMLNIVREFMETVEPEGLDLSCVSMQKRPPFVISTAGTMP